jgi:hypothetical protein
MLHRSQTFLQMQSRIGIVWPDGMNLRKCLRNLIRIRQLTAHGVSLCPLYVFDQLVSQGQERINMGFFPYFPGLESHVNER